MRIAATVALVLLGAGLEAGVVGGAAAGAQTIAGGARRDAGDWQRYRAYDHDRPEPGQRRYYAVRRLSRADRLYRGADGRYYCRREDGTTGLITGGLAGGVLGNIIARGESRRIGTLVDTRGGALPGRSVDRGRIRCR
jgi:hypothetical protein